ncbi:tRNA nucleotidyltransferase (CCA-adding enzyme) [Paenibacillus cellulosilyticus]|uniref:tRNA nucleotidyltransferase (CCA-adding enzyme) n=1 Tax=Paenibacillus cellulosilyticus TaxID=375489 RepID=A0A2V2YVQ7_9BACL|nr:CCA tRNA nucleotidyltransferase [Paenibacillus cellulosilyticus]PWW05517.1 tRNA nucleotidyltransferase (CCA-adding enzyme) [Paenibacillus cellulosilyticus]QKS45446.1 CCA tRNA nucleotidyltransferase [Paenibacillus cellulosilyticus]
MMELYRNAEMEQALPVLETLRQNGYEAVFVGGCVRDVVVGRPLTDIDIATSALPETVMEIFERTVPTGLAHGTVTVLLNKRSYEVTTYRSEAAYDDHRRPSGVSFIPDLEGDLLRRDFTMNAMAIRSDGSLVDLYGGMDDIREGVIRCVGVADERFREDALRMVRAIRFASTFGYSIAVSAWRAIRRNRDLLQHVAMERISTELDKMIGGAGPHRAASWLAASGLLPRTKEPLPPSFAQAAGGSGLRPALRVAQGEGRDCGVPPLTAALTRLPDKDDRWAAVFLALRLSPDDAEETLSRLRFPIRRTAAIRSVVLMHEAAAPLAASASAMPSTASQQQAASQQQSTALESGQQQSTTLESGQKQSTALESEQKQSPALCASQSLTTTHRARWVDAVLRLGTEAAEAWLRIARVYQDAHGELGGMPLSLGTIVWLAHELAAMPCTTIRQLSVNGGELGTSLGLKPGPRTGELLNALLRAAALREVPNEREALLALAQSMEEERMNNGEHHS